MKLQEKIKTVAVVSAAVCLALGVNADTVVTQTINNVEWRFRLNPSTGEATLGIGGDNYNDEAIKACPIVSVNAATIPWTFTGDDGVFYTITKIADWAFFNNPNCTGKLTIPDAVTVVGRNAFCFCKLTGLAGGRNVTEWGNYVFSGNYSMASDYPSLASAVSIGEGLFQNCPLMTGELKLGNSITTLSRLAFCDAKFSGTAVIPASLTTMGAASNYGVFQNNSNLAAIWVKGKANAASQAYTTVYCARFVASCPQMKMILMGQTTKGAHMTQTGSNAMLASDDGVQVFVPANGQWDGLVIGGGSGNRLWYYGPDQEFDLAIDEGLMRATFTPTTANALTNALAWAPSFKTHFDLDAYISVTNTIDLAGVTVTDAMTQGVTFDRLVFSAKTQTQLNAIIETFPATTPLAIDPTGLTENMVIPDDYPNVYVKTVPGVEVRRTTKGLTIIVK